MFTEGHKIEKGGVPNNTEEKEEKGREKREGNCLTLMAEISPLKLVNLRNYI
jgi:hypothetical protein